MAKSFFIPIKNDRPNILSDKCFMAKPIFPKIGRPNKF